MWTLGIDPSPTATGIVVALDGEPVEGWCVPVTQVAQVLELVRERTVGGDLGAACIEDPGRYHLTKQARVAATACEREVKRLWGRKIPIYKPRPQTWRKAVLGTGKAGKRGATIFAEINGWPQVLNTNDHNVLEAACLARYAYDEELVRG